MSQKITLKTLPKKTAQQVFNYVAAHLLKQGKKALIGQGPSCSYLSTDGLKCAAGCLIAPSEYRKDFEGHSWLWLVDECGAPKSHADLITQLQSIHDNERPQDWPSELRQLAQDRKLRIPAALKAKAA